MPKLLSKNLSFLVDFTNHKNSLNNITLDSFSFLGVALCFVEDYVLLILSLSKSYHFPHFLPNGKIELYRLAFFFFFKSFFLYYGHFQPCTEMERLRVPSPSYIIYRLWSTQFHLHLHLPVCIVDRKSKTLCQFNWDHFGRLRHSAGGDRGGLHSHYRIRSAFCFSC